MEGPAEALWYVHGPLRRDLKQMVGQSHQMDEHGPTAPEGELAELQQRYGFWCRMMEVQEEAEEQHLFAALTEAAPGSMDAYQSAHREVGSIREKVASALNAGELHATHELIHQLDHHLEAYFDKEHELVPMTAKHLSEAAQADITAKMAGHMPHELMPKAIGWMLRHQVQSEREGFLRLEQQVAPPQAFIHITGIAKELSSDAEWSELVGRFPELAP